MHLNLCSNRFDNSVQIPNHIIVSHTEHTVSHRDQFLFALLVLGQPTIMAMAIKLNDEIGRSTIEIDDVSTHRMLAAETQVVKSAGAETGPK